MTESILNGPMTHTLERKTWDILVEIIGTCTGVYLKDLEHRLYNEDLPILDHLRHMIAEWEHEWA